MKKLLEILFFILFLITPSWADDIREFEIEGMSIGDSALDFFSESEIKNNMRYMYKSKKYAMFGKDLKNSIYEGFFDEGVRISFRGVISTLSTLAMIWLKWVKIGYLLSKMEN